MKKYYAIFVIFKSGEKLVWQLIDKPREGLPEFYLSGSGILPLMFETYQAAYAKCKKVKKNWTDHKGHLCYGKELVVRKISLMGV